MTNKVVRSAFIARLIQTFRTLVHSQQDLIPEGFRMKLPVLLASIVFSAGTLSAQTASEINSVRLTAEASSSTITLSWPQFANATGYSVYRKLRTEPTFMNLIASPGGGSTGYEDNSISTNVLYEYKVVRNSSQGVGYGYICSGFEVPASAWTGNANHYMGKMILLVENVLAGQISTDILQLRADLKSEGWVTTQLNVSDTVTPASVRAQVQAAYNADPANVKAVYIIGHVPVPYSGNVSQDGHFTLDPANFCYEGGGCITPEHIGAWPCDGYYGEMNGNWTDVSVNNATADVSASFGANWNIPGDGKLDQSDIPSPVELAVGRVDLSRFTEIGGTEASRTSGYLTKARQFRTASFTPDRKAIVDINFTTSDWRTAHDVPAPEVPLAGSAWKTLPMLVGNANITLATEPWLMDELDLLNDAESYLWTFGAGQGQTNSFGQFVGGLDVGLTSGLATREWSGVFNMSIGSFYGDWDNPNNYLRALLTSGKALTHVWSGLPNYWFHHMGMGETIGSSVRQSMNNEPDNAVYLPHTGGWLYIDPAAPEYFDTDHNVAMALMGDPSLRMIMVEPPTALAIANECGLSALSWTASTDAGVAGYHVYRIGSDGAPILLNTTAHAGTTFLSNVPYALGTEFMVRATKLEVTASGSYWNLSMGALATTTTVGVVSEYAAVNVKAFLQGPYVGGLIPMSDGLRAQSFIPQTEPYSALGFTMVGGQGVSVGANLLATTGADAPVDWVLVELRAAGSAATVVSSRCALMQRDGDVVAPDGYSPVKFGVAPGDYFVSIRHRNHLGCMTAAPLALSCTPVAIDFTSPSTGTYGTNAQYDNGTVRMLWAGNTLRDTQLKYTGNGNDRDPILFAIGGSIPTNTVSGYRAEDCNLDGVVKYTGNDNDRDLILFNIGGSVPTNTRNEQLP